MRYLFYVVLLSCFLFGACADSDGSSTAKKKKSLPNSAGQIDEVIVVMDNAEWKGELGKVVREVLAADYPSLPQSEPKFDLRFIPYNAFKDLFRRSSTVIFVSPTDCDSDLCKHAKEAFSKYAKQGSDFLISFKDVYARPQKVVYLSAPDAAGLSSNILVNSDRILKAVYEIENGKAYRSAYASKTNSSLTGLVAKNAFVDCKIPKSYRKVIESDSLLWFRQDLEGAVSNLVFHVKQLPEDYNSKTFNAEEFAMAARDEYGEDFVKSQTEGSFMMVDTMMTPIHFPTLLDGENVIESRGLWYLSKDFMGGPFINYAFFDEAKKRAIFMDAWVYAPQWDKRPSVRRLEQILLNAKYL